MWSGDLKLWHGWFACAVLLGAAGAAGDEDWVMRRVHSELAVPAGATVCISNALGDVRIKPLQDANVAVFAMIQEPGAAAESVQVTLAPDPGEPDQVHVTVTGEDFEPAGRADLAVFVPRDATVQVQTRDGLIESKGIHTALRLKTRGGRIEVKTSGALQAHTETGDIGVLFTGTSWHGDAGLRSVNGTIQVRFPRNADVRVQAGTAGNVTTDFSATVRRAPDSAVKEVRVRVSEGRRGSRGWPARCLRRIVHPFRRVPRVELSTQTGDIVIHKHFPDWQGRQDTEEVP